MSAQKEILENCRRAVEEWERAAKLCEQMLPEVDDPDSRAVCEIMARRYRTSARAQLVLMERLKKHAKAAGK